MKSILSISSLLGITLIFILASCKKEAPINAGEGLDDWSFETHSGNASPDYDLVFKGKEVQRLDIEIDAKYWDLLESEVKVAISSIGGPNNEPYAFESNNPMYIPCQLFHNGKQWYDVGIRLKGSAAIKSAYDQGIKKFPFRLNFDYYQDENPSITGQKFYGFGNLTLENNHKDLSYVREIVASDLYREFEVACPKSTFCRVYINTGSGSVYYGLYTLREVKSESFLSTNFGNNSGDFYEPNGKGSRLNDLSMITNVFFPNKTNSTASLDDITTFYEALVSSERISNPSLWRSELEKTLDVDQFIKFLAANTAMQNWNTYGVKNGNYHLYNNNNTGKLIWIPGDNGESFSEPELGKVALLFDFSNLDQTPAGPAGDPKWPLIRYVYDDPVYRQAYDSHLIDFINGPFSSSNMTSKLNDAHQLITPYVLEEIQGFTFLSNTSEFTNTLPYLLNLANTKLNEAATYLP